MGNILYNISIYAGIWYIRLRTDIDHDCRNNIDDK